MTVKGIIAISGKSGLFKVVAQGKNNVIVEALADKKRFPAYATDRISALDDISIFTDSEDKSLVEIFETIYKKEGGKNCISPKEDAKKLASYLAEVLPDYDREKVYPSDIKKIFMWYNLLIDAGELKEEAVVEEKEDKAKKVETAEKKTTAAKAAPKAVKPKASADKGKAKTSTPKKVAAPKSGGSRGK
ncbi:MAG: DUF5606 domain-containing protein [Bacteroidetes bacterium]|nr:DUF5606 domain-containing protein [Bacteroidota bacterium]